MAQRDFERENGSAKDVEPGVPGAPEAPELPDAPTDCSQQQSLT